MSEPVFFHPRPGSRPSGDRITLEGREARHVRALRLSPGDPVRVTDGRGQLWKGRLRERSDGEAVCRLERRLDPPPALPVLLAFGVAAKKRTLWLVEKAVELGAVALQPLDLIRSRSVADAARSRGFWKKASRRAVAALKQCGGARIPEIAPVRGLHEFLEREERPTPDGNLALSGPDILLDREAGELMGSALAAWSGEPPARVLLGPEGGLTPEERDACRSAGFRPARLSPRTLRFETAGVASLAVAAQKAVSGDPTGDPQDG